MIYYLLFTATWILLSRPKVYKRFHIPGLEALEAFIYNRLEYRTPITRQEYQRMDALLHERNAFFRSLSLHGKARFIHRVKVFTEHKRWMGRKGFQITESDRWLVSSGAVMLTFGLHQYRLDNIHTIRLYPGKFYLALLKRNIVGGTTPRGTVMLSWKHLDFGFLHPEDRLNLAIHEFVHALELSLHRTRRFDRHVAAYLDTWQKVASRELKRIQRGDKTVLRNYAKANEREFFAVAVEHFFEDPDSLYSDMPNVYNHLAFLLQVDPLNPEEDYELNETFYMRMEDRPSMIPVPRSIGWTHRLRKHRWVPNLIFFGLLFASWMGFGLLTLSELVDYGYWPFYILGVVVAYISHYRMLLHHQVLGPLTFPFFAFLGFAPTFVAVFALLYLLFTS